jgi:lipopolysaccharide export system protein LptA
MTTMRILRSSLLASFAALVLAVGVTYAQSSAPPNALQGFSQNRNQPVQINAQTLEVREKKKMAIYTGNVVLVQGDTTMRCKILTIYYDADQKNGGPAVKASTPTPAGTDQIRRIEAVGSVVVTQKGQTATGEKAIYDISDDTVRLFPAPGAGSMVTVTQGSSIVRGPRLIVHLDTGVSHFEGGRVESLFVPSANKAGAQTPPPAAAPAPRPAPKSRSTQGLY